MTKDELIDRLAAIEHERWVFWQREFLAQGFHDASGSVVLPAGTVAHLKRLAAVPFADLPDEVKEHMRAIVRANWHLIMHAVEETDDAEVRL